MVWDPRSGIGKNLLRIPDPGVKRAPDSGSGFATLNTKQFSDLNPDTQWICMIQVSRMRIRIPGVIVPHVWYCTFNFGLRGDLKCGIQIGIRIETNAALRHCGLRESRLLLEMDLLQTCSMRSKMDFKSNFFNAEVLFFTLERMLCFNLINKVRQRVGIFVLSENIPL